MIGKAEDAGVTGTKFGLFEGHYLVAAITFRVGNREGIPLFLGVENERGVARLKSFLRVSPVDSWEELVGSEFKVILGESDSREKVFILNVGNISGDKWIFSKEGVK